MELIKNALIMPIAGTMDEFTGGVFTAENIFREDCVPWRGKAPIPQEPEKFLKGLFIYGGCLFAHFGHFIWESLARLYTVRKCKDYPIIFISPNDILYNMQKFLFRAIGVRNEIIILKYPTHVENLIYSPPGSSIQPLFITDDQLMALAHMNFGNACTGKKIWLSRSRLKCGKILNEDIVEEALREVGYDIIYPETLALTDQVKLVSTAELVSGFDGSQFFSILFSKRACGKLIVFNRRKFLAPTIPYIFERKGVQFNLEKSQVEIVKGTIDMAGADYIVLNPGKIIDILRQQH